MEYVYDSSKIIVRKMEDKEEDYLVLLKWLSTPEVLDYYGGRDKPYGYNQIIEKYSKRAQGKDDVTPFIIEYDFIPIGYVQCFMTNAKDYKIDSKISTDNYNKVFGIDMFIGDTLFWNKGLGSKVMTDMIDYLTKKQNADYIFIDPIVNNKRAIRCYEKCGFEMLDIIKNREELNGELKDSCIMGLDVREYVLSNYI